MLAKVVLHIHIAPIPASVSLDQLSAHISGLLAPAENTMGRVEITHAEWITDWAEETDDDVPLDTGHDGDITTPE